jgi:hypothetical protein
MLYGTPCDLAPDLLADFVDPHVEQRVRHDVVLVEDLLLFFFRHLDFGCGRGRAGGRIEPGQKQQESERAVEDAAA